MKLFYTLFLLGYSVNAFNIINTVKIDLNKYQGTWFQIADYPQFYEYFFCNKCTRANYIIQSNNTVRVINQARGFNDCTIKGTAKIQDANDPGKLVIHFDGFGSNDITAQYWVYDIGPVNNDNLYEWSIVSNENKTTCYILYRQPNMNRELYQELLNRLQKLNFNINKLKITNQENCYFTF